LLGLILYAAKLFDGGNYLFKIERFSKIHRAARVYSFGDFVSARFDTAKYDRNIGQSSAKLEADFVNGEFFVKIFENYRRIIFAPDIF